MTAITHYQMKQNLQQARRSSRVEITPERARAMRDAMADGCSKKILCTIYGVTYDDLKTIKQCK